MNSNDYCVLKYSASRIFAAGR